MKARTKARTVPFGPPGTGSDQGRAPLWQEGLQQKAEGKACCPSGAAAAAAAAQSSTGSGFVLLSQAASFVLQAQVNGRLQMQGFVHRFARSAEQHGLSFVEDMWYAAVNTFCPTGLHCSRLLGKAVAEVER